MKAFLALLLATASAVIFACPATCSTSAPSASTDTSAFLRHHHPSSKRSILRLVDSCSDSDGNGSGKGLCVVGGRLGGKSGPARAFAAVVALSSAMTMTTRPLFGSNRAHPWALGGARLSARIDATLRLPNKSPTPTVVIGGRSSQPSLSILTLSLRGGAQSSPSSESAIATMVRSVLLSPSVPSPVKLIVEFLCRIAENLAGVRLLPRPEPEVRSKSERKRSKREEGAGGGVAGSRKKRAGRTRERSDNGDASSPPAKKTRKSKKLSAEKSADASSPSFTKSDGSEAGEQTNKEASAKQSPPTTKQKKKRPDAASQKFLSSDLKSSNPNYRIQRELKEFLSSPPPGLSVKISGKNVRLWVVTLKMPDNCVYAGESYRLRVRFPDDYPTSPPSVFFLPPTPRHEHVYTNGDICLSLLGKDWRPIMTAQSLAQAIMSILCGAQCKSLPRDNPGHAGAKPGKRQDDWVYHDDNC